ncbi:MAG TPA: class I SAM-dependent methyltransferase [Solirubrobacteraceae bacterium]|nr:class I SAM-dependent methyltransferase [Solirubrobacteraceae bacterium]
MAATESADTRPAVEQGAPVILNLGCGQKTSPRAVNIDFSIHLRLRKHLPDRLAPLIFTGQRLELYRSIDGEIMVHDLRKGIPAETGTVDAVYHSHVLEHIDRTAVPGFFREVHRVLRPGGIHRIVCPDLERLTRAYLASLEAEAPDHDRRVVAMIEQSVRREAHGSSIQRPWRRRLENALLGDARKRGETHQWMWDRVNLRHALEEAGFHSVSVMAHDRSQIPDWDAIGLDRDADGGEYKRGSLYVEATR